MVVSHFDVDRRAGVFLLRNLQNRQRSDVELIKSFHRLLNLPPGEVSPGRFDAKPAVLTRQAVLVLDLIFRFFGLLLTGSRIDVDNKGLFRQVVENGAQLAVDQRKQAVDTRKAAVDSDALDEFP